VGGSFDLVAGHNATNLVRLNPDGTVDESFHAAASGLDELDAHLDALK
jgi:hypothetical protein